MTEDLPDVPEAIRPLLVPGETVAWSGRSEPMATFGYMLGEFALSAFLLAYVAGVPFVGDVVGWVIDRILDVASIGSAGAGLGTVEDIVRIGVGLLALAWGALGLGGVAIWVWTYGRASHAVTDRRILSVVGGRTSSTWLRNVAAVRTRASRHSSGIKVGLASSPLQHWILGIRDVAGAERAVNAGISRAAGSDGFGD